MCWFTKKSTNASSRMISRAYKEMHICNGTCPSSKNLQNAEANLAVSSTGSGPTPPRGMSRTDDRTSRCLLQLRELLSKAPSAPGGRKARPEGKFDAALGSAETSRAARNGRSFIILAMVFDGWIWACHEKSCCFWSVHHPFRREHIMCWFYSDGKRYMYSPARQRDEHRYAQTGHPRRHKGGEKESRGMRRM